MKEHVGGRQRSLSFLPVFSCRESPLLAGKHCPYRSSYTLFGNLQGNLNENRGVHLLYIKSNTLKKVKKLASLFCRTYY